METLKYLFIFGDTGGDNVVWREEQTVKNFCVQTDCEVMHYQGVRADSLFYQRPQGSIDENTKIMMIVHGAPCHFDPSTHCITLTRDSLMHTSLYLDYLQWIAGENAIQVHLFSCHGGMAVHDYMESLKPKSMLVSYVPSSRTSTYFFTEGLYNALIESPDLSPYQILMNKIEVAAAISVSIAVSYKDSHEERVKNEVFYFGQDRSIEWTIEQPEKDLERRVEYFQSFYDKVHENTASPIPLVRDTPLDVLAYQGLLLYEGFHYLDPWFFKAFIQWAPNVATVFNRPATHLGTMLSVELVRLDKLEQLEMCLKNGMNPNLLEDGLSPLAYAVTKNSYKMAELLLQYGAQPMGIEQEKTSPILLAIKQLDMTMLGLLLRDYLSFDGYLCQGEPNQQAWYCEALNTA